MRSKARHSWSQPFHVRRSDGAGSRGRHLPGTWSPHLGTMQLHKGALVHLQHTPGTWSPAAAPAKQPIFKAFCDFGDAKMACNGLKTGAFHFFVHPKWSRIIFGKTHF